MKNEIRITFNSKRKIGIIIIFLLFSLLGLFFIFQSNILITIWIIKNKLFIQFLGLITFLLSTIFLALFVNMYSRKTALILDSEGIIDTSSPIRNTRRIRWQNIVDIQKLELSGSTFILVFVDNPQQYINEENKLSKWINKNNYKFYRTPISISLVSLNTYVDTLEKQLKENWKKYKI
ncbi:STM3941 family protein [Sphingobacterium faecium]|uniref:STM3941 family protein n=1 Tax=Sphingobacterium faecium TaxID=34087 RepID=UPI000D348624|nr:STM3941 family protein [Sphingobacterium faecium]PTX14076.1 hypothetical protein C8N37_101835 [Sphingobacterium faecium]